MSNLAQRVLTAILLIPCAVAGILYLPWRWLAVGLGLFVVVGALEWTFLAGWRGRKGIQVVFITAVLGSAAVCLVGPAEWVFAILGAAVLWWILALLFVVVVQRGTPMPTALSALAWSLIGWLLLVPAMVSLIVLHRSGADGPHFLLLLMVMVWSADIGAYFVGRALGRRKLASRVSPGKSWEGAIGGAIAAASAAYVFALYFTHPDMLPAFMAVAGVTIVVSILGDLTESLAKRVSGSKDSGQLLPGHGGVLDRIDSLTAAGPVFLAGLVLIGMVAI